MLNKFKQYYSKAKMNQERLYQGYTWTKEDINDDLIYNVPIYDVVNRKYAAFSSLLEAIKKKDDDPKENGKYFNDHEISDIDFMYMCYLFRLCGSGINYKPKQSVPFHTHGFGNFWIVDLLRLGMYRKEDWLKNLPLKKYSDNKGYLLPMVSGGLRSFILKESLIVSYINLASLTFDALSKDSTTRSFCASFNVFALKILLTYNNLEFNKLTSLSSVVLTSSAALVSSSSFCISYISAAILS